ncbi:MFS transporter [Rothia sp. AR01]|uniref:MFS transporter n=1 Tax=Rothia santali TaxID=2949643 RepID=A0A9X2H9S8_9MICC|nr:MFS transporter [Rothia santali]MCP3425639.1 MFS transporter [Rothia santali]
MRQRTDATTGAAERRGASGAGRGYGVVLGLCWVAVFFDGLDMFMFGATIPAMLADASLGLDPGAAGTIGSLATFGMLVGALSAGLLTDAVGRRWGIAVCCTVFSLASGLCAAAPTAEVFGAGRLIAGLGLGGLLPTAIAMVSEFAPDRRRNLSIGALMTGHHAGGIAAALLGIWLVGALGWRSIYWVGVAPVLVIVPLALLVLPESPSFLAARERRWHGRAGDSHDAGCSGPPRDVGRSGDRHDAGRPGPAALAGLAGLFRGGSGPVTLFFWLTSFAGLLLVYGVSTWLPALMQAEGHDIGSSLGFLLTVNAGGIAGMLVAGRVSDAWGPVRVATLWFLVTALWTVLLSVRTALPLTYALVFLVGLFLFSAQTMVYAAVAHVFPPGNRATAIGWTTGMGRFGAVFGPWMGGWLFATGSQSWGFAAFALAAVCGTATLLCAGWAIRRRPRGGSAAA